MDIFTAPTYLIILIFSYLASQNLALSIDSEIYLFLLFSCTILLVSYIYKKIRYKEDLNYFGIYFTLGFYVGPIATLLKDLDIHTNAIAVALFLTIIVFIQYFLESSFIKQDDIPSQGPDAPISTWAEVEDIIKIASSVDQTELPLFKNLESTVNDLSNLLSKTPNPKWNQSLVICVDAKWGAGKTSALNILKNKLTNLDFMTFSSLSFSGGDELIADFLNELGKEAERIFGINLNQDLNKIVQIIAPNIDNGLILSQIYDLVNKNESLDEIVSKISKRISRAASEKRLIIVMDDIDRSYPEDMLLIIKMINLLSKIPRLVFILPFDYLKTSRILFNHINHEYKGFLSKIVDYRIRLSPYSYSESKAIFQAAFIENSYLEIESSSYSKLEYVWLKVVENLLRNYYSDIFDDTNEELGLELSTKQNSIRVSNTNPSNTITISKAQKGGQALNTLSQKSIGNYFIRYLADNYIFLMSSNPNNIRTRWTGYLSFLNNNNLDFESLARMFYKEIIDIYYSYLEEFPGIQKNPDNDIDNYKDALMNDTHLPKHNLEEIFLLSPQAENRRDLYDARIKHMSENPLESFRQVQELINTHITQDILNPRNLKRIAFSLSKKINLNDVELDKINNIVKDIVRLY